MPTVEEQLALLRRWLDAPDAEARCAIVMENGGVPPVSAATATLLDSEEYAAYRRRLAEHLLHGPYTPPPLRRWDRAYCLVRDCEVIITGWSDGLLPWPRCRVAGRSGRGSGG